MQLIDLSTLGTDYNIIDNDGKLVKVVKLINQDDILDAALGEFYEDAFGTMQEYIDASLERLCGFPKDPTSICWHTTEEDEFDVLDIIDTYVSKGYDYIIVEVIE